MFTKKFLGIALILYNNLAILWIVHVFLSKMNLTDNVQTINFRVLQETFEKNSKAAQPFISNLVQLLVVLSEVSTMGSGKDFVVGEVGSSKLALSNADGVEKILADRSTGTENLVVGIYVCNPRSTLEMHYHKVEEFICILYGSGVVRDRRGREYKIGAESTIYCAPGPEGAHEFENTGDVPLGLIFAHPAPEDPEMISLK